MRYTEFDFYYVMLFIRAAALCVGLAALIGLLAPWSLLAAGWLFWMWQRLAPIRLAQVRIDPHSFHEHLFAVATRLDVRVFANGYFVRPTSGWAGALVGSVFIYVEAFGTVEICGPRYQVYRLLRRGLVTALCSTTCPHAACPQCRARAAGAARVTARPPQTYVTGELVPAFAAAIDRQEN